MAKEKVVVAKRGCTCCGTGCVLMGAIIPTVAFLSFETLGLAGALAVWPVALAAAHGMRAAMQRRIAPPPPG
jgi:hypothetical protein